MNIVIQYLWVIQMCACGLGVLVSIWCLSLLFMFYDYMSSKNGNE